MPNWFNFTLNVSGKKEDVQSFVENVKGTEKYDTEVMSLILITSYLSPRISLGVL